MERVPSVSGTTNLIDILDRILDKGLVIAGDVRISLANVELLTIRIRLLICSVEKAESIGLNWWKHDPNLTQPVTSHVGLPPGTVRRVEAIKRAAAPRAAKKRREVKTRRA